jgi:hypothetical protein
MSNYSLLTTKNGIKWDVSANNVTLVSLNGNGALGEVLLSNGPTVAPSWGPTSGSSTVTITDTSSNSTFYPTFVSGSGAGQTLRADITSNPFTFNPSTGTLTTTSFVASGSSTTNTIGSSGMTVANSGGNLTINQGGLVCTPVSSSAFNVSGGGTGGGTLNLQQNGSTKATIASTGFQTTLINLSDDNSTAARFTGLSNSFFSTPSVVYTNLQPPTGYNTVLNIGAYTNSSGTVTANGYDVISIYSPQVRVLSSTADTSPLVISGTTSKSIQQNNTSSTNTTLDLTATANLNSRYAKVLLSGGSGTGGASEPSAQLICNTTTANYPNPSVTLLTGSASNTKGIFLTNNHLTALPQQTNTIAVTNTELYIKSDSIGDGSEYVKMDFTSLQLTFRDVHGNLFQIENGLLTSNGNLTFGKNPATNLQMGILERGTVDTTLSGSTNLGWDDCFLTIISTPTGSRAFVLKNPDISVTYSGYWVAICNRSRTNTIAIKQADGTLLYTIPLNPSENNFSGGSTARFAVSPTGFSWFRVS